MRVVEIRDEAGLLSLRTQWNTLLRKSAADVVFLTWEWIAAWWSVYGRAGTLRILAAYDESGQLAGIAPLRSHVVTRCAPTVSALVFMADLSCDSDYLDFVTARGQEARVMEAFCRHWSTDLKNGTVLLLNEIPEGSPTISLLRTTAASGNQIWKEAAVPCATVRLPGAWEEYLATLKPRFRTKVRSVLRTLEERPDIRFGLCENPEQVARLLSALFDLHTRRWAQAGRSGVFGWGQKREFYEALSPIFLERGWLGFSWMEWNGRLLACQYGLVYNGMYSQLQEGYEPASEHWSPGVGLRAWTIREYIRRGVTEYDFLGGIGRHKSDWGAETKCSKHILLASDTWKNRVFSSGPEWVERARETAGKLLPNRRAVDSTQRSLANGNISTEWIRSGVAAAYLNLGLPALIRPLRERYQLTMSRGGRRISCRRRNEPSARILYYHRVNDEEDPFFPAISTALFEQQVRFLARHYRVVNLTRLMDHLGGSAAEPVVAITFDDGYQDNYQQAFPILQRYGLPATIFLATGSVDTRSALWFEEMAEAMKRTRKESIDLEIDLPRRFWMRDVQERLSARNEIYSMLRKLPHAERQRWLEDIIRQLDVSAPHERRDKMLTWDQVRLMCRGGIDFGGHTVTHPFLSGMPREQVLWEASESKRRIEEETQAPVHYFAYPSGREEDFGKWNEEAVISAGYKAAVTTIWGVNYASTNPMELRRGGPWENSLALYACKLDWYQLRND